MISGISDQLWRICLSSDMTTYDPYDVWKTKFGSAIKRNYYRGGVFNKSIAGAVYFTDIFLNNRLRIGYKKQEYAIVRALSAQILHSKYKISGNEACLQYASQHIEWLLKNHLKAKYGIGWGLDFEHPVSATLTYSKTTPFSTITPYVLEALIAHEQITGQIGKYENLCSSIFNFFNKDLKILEQNEEFEVTSYGPFEDRRVTNSVSYTMYSLVILDKYFRLKLGTADRVLRLFNYIKSRQSEDGSWLYSDQGESFVDCFHSCIIIKNLIKSRSSGISLPGCDEVISKGYSFLKNVLFDKKYGLYGRFARRNKPDFSKYDLYDNAEMLQCAILMGDLAEARKIVDGIEANFIKDDIIYSSINILGHKHNANMLRWAVIPYMYSLSLMEIYESEN